MPADHAQKPPGRKQLGTGTAHRTCRSLQISSEKVRIISNQTGLTSGKIFKEMDDIKTDIWRTPLSEASERCLNRLRVKKFLPGKLINRNVMIE